MAEAESDPDAVGYYDRTGNSLASRYESVAFEEVHSALLDHLPRSPAQVLDIGAGSGRDARALADLGHRVTAVEPAASLRRLGRTASSNIEWVDDRLPDLMQLGASRRRYDFILCSAVLMSLPPSALDRSLATMARLLNPRGRLALSLRDPLPHERVLHRHSGTMLLSAAERAGLRLIEQSRVPDALGRGFEWHSYVFGRAGPAAARDGRMPAVREP